MYREPHKHINYRYLIKYARSERRNTQSRTSHRVQYSDRSNISDIMEEGIDSRTARL
jgi:hypothetical protein